ncbi:unnamed protein product, partial [Amoebophrya sp. A25]
NVVIDFKEQAASARPPEWDSRAFKMQNYYNDSSETDTESYGLKSVKLIDWG